MSSLNALSNISFFLSLFSLATSSESLTHFMTFLFIYYSTLSHHFEFLVHAEEWGLQSYQAYRGHHNHNTPYCCPELHEAALCRFQPPSQTGDKTDRVSSHFWSDFLSLWLPKGESRLLQVLSPQSQHRLFTGMCAESLLFILYTHNCTPTHSSNNLIKFPDDTTLMGLI